MGPIVKAFAVAALLLAGLGCPSCTQDKTAQAATAAPAAPLQPPTHTAKQETAMKPFVLIFRQSSRTITELEKTQRSAQVRDWARGVNAAGGKLDPRILSEQLYLWTEHDRGTPGHATEGAVTALLFLEAASFDDAVRIGNEHPALRYGSTVEVRPWAPPATPPPPQPPQPPQAPKP
jgi:hypothetical protein